VKTLVGWLVFSFVFVVVGSYTWMHLRHAALAPPYQLPQQESAPSYTEEQEARGIVTIHGPLLDYMARDGTAKIETLQFVAPKARTTGAMNKPPAIGAAAASTIKILEQTFVVRTAVQLPFEIPAHTASPKLCGNYQSFWKPGTSARTADADVELLLLNEQQYSAFLNGRPGEATFAAEDAVNQEVNAFLPPTLDRPAEYHLIFRNNSSQLGKKLVQADFQIDF